MSFETIKLTAANITVEEILRFKELVYTHIPVDSTMSLQVDDFFGSNYTIVFLGNDNFLGYTDEGDHIMWWYLYTAQEHGAFRKVAKIYKSFDKPLYYTGVIDSFSNNSVVVKHAVYQLLV